MNTTKLQVGNLVWTVKKVAENNKNLIVDDIPCYGVCYPDSLEIYIRGDGLNKQLYMSYLIHELTHAYIFSLGFTYRMNKKFDEEEVCYFMQHHASEILASADYCYKQLFSK